MSDEYLKLFEIILQSNFIVYSKTKISYPTPV